MITYVGADARQSGKFQGELIADLPNKGDLNGDGVLQLSLIHISVRVDGDVGAGGRRCSRTQSDLDHHSLSPGRRHKRKSDGIRRRVGKENPAAAAGGR